MDLQKLLGDAYQEGMSIEDINTALQGKNLVDLSTGGYVDVNKYNRELNDLRSQIATKDAEINNAKNSAKTNATNNAENNALIEQLQQQVREQGIESNKLRAVAGISEAKGLLEIKEDDESYTSFLTSVSELDKEVSNNIVKYFNTQIKNAYEKGKNDSVKNNLGNMGKQQLGGTKKAPELGAFGKQLAEKSFSDKSNVDYFSRNK